MNFNLIFIPTEFICLLGVSMLKRELKKKVFSYERAAATAETPVRFGSVRMQNYFHFYIADVAAIVIVVYYVDKPITILFCNLIHLKFFLCYHLNHCVVVPKIEQFQFGELNHVCLCGLICTISSGSFREVWWREASSSILADPSSTGISWRDWVFTRFGWMRGVCC